MKKRRLFSLFLSFALLLPLFSLTSADAYEDFTLDAKAGLLIEADTGEILYEKNAHQENYPASLTKVMVALLVFAAIVLFYFALKRFAPFLLPYLAHVKNTGRRQAQHGACDETIPLIRGLSGMSQSSERDAGNPMPGTRESF